MILPQSVVPLRPKIPCISFPDAMVLNGGRGIRDWSYPTMLYLGILAGIVAQNYAAHLSNLAPFSVWLATVILLPTALVGARLLYIATHLPIYLREPKRIWSRSEGGLSLYGAVPVMLLGSLLVLRWLALPFWRFWDVSVYCILTGMIFTRLGCLLNGCCAGRPTEGFLGMQLRDHRGVVVRRVPTQLLEAGWASLLLIVAIVLFQRSLANGELFLLMLGGYALGRSALQHFREYRQTIGRVDLQQAISGLYAAGAIFGILLLELSVRVG